MLLRLLINVTFLVHMSTVQNTRLPYDPTSPYVSKTMTKADYTWHSDLARIASGATAWRGQRYLAATPLSSEVISSLANNVMPTHSFPSMPAITITFLDSYILSDRINPSNFFSSAFFIRVDCVRPLILS